MPLDPEKVRAQIAELLKQKKSLTEREVKAAAARALKARPKEIGGGLVRQVRKSMGIDRPAAIAYARAMLAKSPRTPAATVIQAVQEKFGIRFGSPDVSRLRTTKARTGRKPGSSRAKPTVVAGGDKPVPLGVVAKGTKAGTITVRFEGSGSPDGLAAFFMSLGRTK